MPIDTEKIAKVLFAELPGDSPYPENEKLQGHLIDQYKLYVEMADRIGSRRQTANSYFLTVNTALLGFVGYITAKDSSEYLWLLGIVGVVLCYLWYRIIRSFRDLSTAKYLVVHQIETKLPIRPYDAEWEGVGRGKDSSLYKPVTHIETGVPWVFLALHAYVLFRTIPWQSFRALMCG